MTNMEYYREQIKAIEDNGDGMAVDKETGELRVCGNIECSSCALSGGNYLSKILHWLMAEHKEEPTLTQRDYHLAQLLPDGWVARDEDKMVWWYKQKPQPSGEHPRRGNYCVNLTLFKPDLSFIHWEDTEPWSVEDLRKLKVRKNND